MSKKNRRGGGPIPPNQQLTAAVPSLLAETSMIQNSTLGDAIGLSDNPFGGIGGIGQTERISSPDTLFKNLRWFLVSNFRQVLSQAYVEIGLIQTVVDVPVDDAFRDGIEVTSKQLDENQIEELLQALERDDDLVTLAQAAKWNRLFGGGAILILTDQDPESPLDVAALSADDRLEFRAVDMWELYWDRQNTEDHTLDVDSSDENDVYNYYGQSIHRSRVLVMKGLVAPSFIRPRLRGWGTSVVEVLIRSINQYLKATDLGFEVLDEFKLDVFKMKNLVNLLNTPSGAQKVKSRIQLANWQKNYQNALVMDAEDDFDHKQLSFAGLAEAMEGIRVQVAADIRMTRFKLFGESGGTGLSDGKNEGDLEVYNSMVQSSVRTPARRPTLKVCELKCQVLFGFVPDDLRVKFKPLRILSAEGEENVKTQKFNRALAARSAGEITTFEFRETCNKGGLLDVTLDTKVDQLNPEDPEVEELVSEGSGAGDEELDENGEPVKPGASGEEKKTSGKSKKKGDEAGERKDRKTGEPSNKEPENKEPKPSQKNRILLMPTPFTRLERIVRTVTNSGAFDKASYEADGGDGWVHPGRKEFFTDPVNVDKSLWERAKEASSKALGEVRWQFVTWWYKKQGGKFA